MKKITIGIFQVIAGLLLGVLFITQATESESYAAWLSMLLPCLLVFYGFANLKEAKQERE